jgi:hypothetical protein
VFLQFVESRIGLAIELSDFGLKFFQFGFFFTQIFLQLGLLSMISRLTALKKSLRTLNKDQVPGGPSKTYLKST